MHSAPDAVVASETDRCTPLQQSRCDCRTDERSLVLLAVRLVEDYPELCAFGAVAGWQTLAEQGAVRVEIGVGRPISGVAQLVHFLGGILDPPRLAALRATWISSKQPLDEQLPRLLDAELLLSLAPTDSSALSTILEHRRLETWFQPVVRADTGILWGYECLVRGRMPDGSLVSPDQLIRWSRQENLIFLLDRLCRETHLRNARAFLGDRKICLLVNFLPTAIYNPEFCLATTLAAAKESGIDPERIYFEVVETDKVLDQGHLRGIMDFYRRKGFRVALDDVGSGYSGLAMLADLDPDLIKIDRSLVCRALESPIHRSICNCLVEIGKAHGKIVLAEGVETVEERELMTRLGVDLLQGFLFGHPAPDTGLQTRGQPPEYLSNSRASIPDPARSASAALPGLPTACRRDP
jgi:EAL domain-containing protein (putative c-di-GMP-specific phosphodiesterase class I)